MPLLLAWCYEPDEATCLAALQALQQVIKHTWPRMPAHASFLWAQLQQITEHQMRRSAAEPRKQSAPDAAETLILQCIAEIAEMLFLSGGSCFQNSVRDLAKHSRDPASDVMLQPVAWRMSVSHIKNDQHASKFAA